MILSRNFVLLYFIINLSEAHESPSSLTDIRIEDVELKQKGGDSRRNCRLDVHNDTINPQPLLVKLGTDEFYNPNVKGIIEIPYGRSIELHCNNKFDGKFDGDKKLIPMCIGEKTFFVKGKRVEFSDFVCKSWSTSTARRTGEKCHEGLASVIEIGFQLPNSSRFLRIADLCHNEFLESTLYVHHFLNPSSAQQQHNIARTNFREGNFYNGKNVDKLYKQVTHQETIGKILGGNHEKYFNEKKSWFLARGHLSAKADHIYGSQQRATFYFINAAPQWQIFNAGNWQTIEDDIRTHVSRMRMYVECYTGTWGIGTLADINGVHKDLYLYIDENNQGLIPIPKIYYRVVIEPNTKRGIAFIGVNNPHLTLQEIQNDYIICEDISDMITWINWKKDNILLGYSYACEVNEFSTAIGQLPFLDVEDILY